MNKNNIVFVTDDNQFKYTIFNIFQILSQKSKYPNEFYVFYKSDSKYINDLVNSNELSFINFRKIENELNLFDSKISHITNLTNLRLYLPELLPDLDQIIYLDTDILINGDISEINEFVETMDFINIEIFAAQERIGKPNFPNDYEIKHKTSDKDYYNAGILFMNLKLMRKNNFVTKAIKIFSEDSHNLIMADQQIINTISMISSLPYKFNIGRSIWKKNYANIMSNLEITHFITSAKPWIQESALKNIEFGKKGALSFQDFSNLYSKREEWRSKFDNFNIWFKNINSKCKFSIIYSTNNNSQQIRQMKSSLITLFDSLKKSEDNQRIEILFHAQEEDDWSSFNNDIYNFFVTYGYFNFIIHRVKPDSAKINDLLNNSPNLIHLYSPFYSNSENSFNLDNDTLLFVDTNYIVNLATKAFKNNLISSRYWKRELYNFDIENDMSIHYKNNAEVEKYIEFQKKSESRKIVEFESYIKYPCLWSYFINNKMFVKQFISIEKFENALLDYRDLTYKHYKHIDGFTDGIKRDKFEIKRSSDSLVNQRIYDEPFVIYHFRDKIHFFDMDHEINVDDFEFPFQHISINYGDSLKLENTNGVLYHYLNSWYDELNSLDYTELFLSKNFSNNLDKEIDDWFDDLYIRRLNIIKYFKHDESYFSDRKKWLKIFKKKIKEIVKDNYLL